MAYARGSADSASPHRLDASATVPSMSGLQVPTYRPDMGPDPYSPDRRVSQPNNKIRLHDRSLSSSTILPSFYVPVIMNKPSGKRLLLPVICLAVAVLLFVKLHSHTWSSSPTHDSTAAEHVLNSPSTSSEQHVQTSLQLSPPSKVEEAIIPDETKDSDESPPPDCSVIKLSMLYGAHRLPELFEAIDTHRQHSQRWGCSLENLEHELTNRPHFSKQYFILSHMLNEMAKPADQRKEWIMWVDADSIVINPAISPEVFLPPAGLDGVFGLFTADHNGLNDGLFSMRVHPSSIDLLTEVIDYNFAHPDEDLGWLGEQIAMERIITKREDAAREAGRPTGIAWLPRPWFNSFQFEAGFEGEPGHHIVHFAGLGETRVGLMGQWLAELKTDQAKWEIPFEDTFYRAAIPEFWERYAANVSHAGV